MQSNAMQIHGHEEQRPLSAIPHQPPDFFQRKRFPRASALSAMAPDRSSLAEDALVRWHRPVRSAVRASAAWAAGVLPEKWEPVFRQEARKRVEPIAIR